MPLSVHLLCLRSPVRGGSCCSRCCLHTQLLTALKICGWSSQHLSDRLLVCALQSQHGAAAFLDQAAGTLGCSW